MVGGLTDDLYLTMVGFHALLCVAEKKTQIVCVLYFDARKVHSVRIADEWVIVVDSGEISVEAHHRDKCARARAFNNYSRACVYIVIQFKRLR